MINFILRGYIKAKEFSRRMTNFIRLLHFSYYLYKKDIFNQGDPRLVLRVLQEFTFWSSREYDSTLVMNRDACQGASLLHTLIDKWFKDNSSITLNQILQVLKTEFIEREKNGRKQF